MYRGEAGICLSVPFVKQAQLCQHYLIWMGPPVLGGFALLPGRLEQVHEALGIWLEQAAGQPGWAGGLLHRVFCMVSDSLGWGQGYVGFRTVPSVGWES